MESGDRINSVDDFHLDSRWVIDSNQLFVGPKIGEGAHAEVYKGKYNDQLVAIKVFRKGETPEEVTKIEGRFVREVAMLSKVEHKNIVKFIGACKEPVMVVTELLSGGTLRKYMVNMRPRSLEMRVAVGFALDIARGMECLHSHGIIHRDLQPENLLLTTDRGTVKLADFGIAREETVTGMMTAEAGTYRWMAPELYNKKNLKKGEKTHYTHKADVYSFALVLWELLNNKVPFERMPNIQAAYAAGFKKERPDTEDLPGEFSAILTSCWNEDPETRPNFSQIIEMLLNCLDSVCPPEVIPFRVFASENAILPPESQGMSSLMAAAREGSEETGEGGGMENMESEGLFSCCW